MAAVVWWRWAVSHIASELLVAIFNRVQASYFLKDEVIHG